VSFPALETAGSKTSHFVGPDFPVRPVHVHEHLQKHNNDMTEPLAGPSRKRKRPASIPTHDPTPSTFQPHSWYTTHLNAHILDSKANLTGTSSSQPSSTVLNTYTTPPEYLSPIHGLWTSYDKSSFFASLSRHSRFRTDLIACEISKPVSEITYYLQILGDGVEAVKRRGSGGGDGEGGRGWRDRSRRWGKSHFWRLGEAPSAREASKEWIGEEEKLAAGVEEVRVDKERFRRKVGKIAVREHLKVLGARSDGKRARDGKKAVEGELGRRWKREDYGEELDGGKLGDIDVALRPRWQEWYGNRLKGEVGVKDEKMEMRGGAVDKYDRIAEDEVMLKKYEERGKDDLSKEEKAEWKMIVNRKRARRKHRLKKLLHEGLTIEQVDQQGGVDMAYAKRKGKKPAFDFDTEQDSSLDDTLSQTASISRSRRATTPAPARGRIDEENRVIRQLEAIPRPQRNAEQKSQLSEIKKRQKTRTRFRKHKLLTSGMSLEEIEIGGGINAVYLRQLGRSEEMQRGRSETPDVVTPVDTPGLVSLRELGIDQYLVEKGWDVFNYAQLSLLQ
jgi:hypothetical protein